MIMIFGGTGSLGKKLIERFIAKESICIFSRDEAKHWTLKNEISSGKLSTYQDCLKFCIGDVRDKERVKAALRQYSPDKVIIAAALKQVDTCEKSPTESIKTNIEGTQNIIDAINDSHDNSVEKTLFVSTDKACAPVNVYGMCKAISERLVTSQVYTSRSGTDFLAVRYGNVLESRGSIIPLFKYQCENSKTLTVTDPMMTRFVMTLDQSVDLIKRTIEYGTNGEMWIPKLPSMRIGDLAELFAERYNKKIKIVGSRPGEKKHESLICSSESERTVCKLEDYVVLPACEKATGDPFEYTSNDNVMSKTELKEFLLDLNIFDQSLSEFKGRTIEEIRISK